MLLCISMSKRWFLKLLFSQMSFHFQLCTMKRFLLSVKPDLVPMTRREYFYCRDTGHLIANCPLLRRKEQAQTSKKTKSVGFVRSVSAPNPVSDEPGNDCLDSSYWPFISKGLVSLSGKEEDNVPIAILHDTGATQSLILESVVLTLSYEEWKWVCYGLRSRKH